jgi:hypothetical protein
MTSPPATNVTCPARGVVRSGNRCTVIFFSGHTVAAGLPFAVTAPAGVVDGLCAVEVRQKSVRIKVIIFFMHAKVKKK